MKKLIALILIIHSIFLSAQTNAPEWSKNLSIYEVNIRQYTPEGTFQAFEKHLPELKKMGVGILWLMPVNPIGEINRKGSLGSYYSVQNYNTINPEFGNLDDFKHLVNEIHNQGMYVIIDWVANHTAWDNKWMKNNQDYYTKNSNGDIISPVPDWKDVADLNYDNMALNKAMIVTMESWIKDTGIDGFRCDVAMMVPDNFWKPCFGQLRLIKPDIFLLAEAEGKQFHDDGFNMTYTWNRYHTMNEIAKQNMKPAMLDSIIKNELSIYSPESYFMNFTSNHDENSWNGTEFERLDGGAKTFAVLCATMPGMQLIYSGQEVGLNKRLKFFDKDTINWNVNNGYREFYSELIELKKNNPALWNGNFGGDYKSVNCDNENVFCFTRGKGGNKIFVILNLANSNQKIDINSQGGKYFNAFMERKQKLKSDQQMDLTPWEYIVLVKK